MPAIAAIVVPCASRKRRAIDPRLIASALPQSSQDDVAREWINRLRTATASGSAGELYGGRGFSLASAAGSRLKVANYIISAGLGLVESPTLVPAYSLTVSSGSEDWIGARSTTPFDRAAWWNSIKMGPCSTKWSRVFSQPGVVLVALSRPYAAMVGADLGGLSADDRCRLRIFGQSLEEVLPAVLHDQIMPYDLRLEALLPGTRTDFAQRALSHFARLKIAGDLAADRETVEVALKGLQEPERIERPRAGNDQIVAAIRRHLRHKQGVRAVLRLLRDHDGIACEQKRFTRLYHAAKAEVEAA